MCLPRAPEGDKTALGEALATTNENNDSKLFLLFRICDFAVIIQFLPGSNPVISSLVRVNA